MRNPFTEGTASEITARYTYGTWKFQKGWKPLHVKDAEGCFFTDDSGKKYLDFSSQLMCVNLGHKNKAIIDSISKQAEQLAFISPGYATDARAELTRLLLEVLPEGLTKYFFTTSGTEANEAAVKITRMFTGKYKIISRYNSYHGSTASGISCTGDMRRWSAEPAGKIDGVIFAPECNCYHCPMGKNYPGCGISCVEYIAYMIENENNVAAVLVEPIVGTNGILVPPDEYFPRLRKICDEHNVLLIADEVMTGWGRTGKWFALDHWNIKPDILYTAKGITSAAVPLGLVATSQKIADYFENHYFSHGHTYEAHPLTLAPAVAAINEYKRLNIMERVANMEGFFKSELDTLKSKHPSVGDIRGKGMFWAVELVKNRNHKTPFNFKKDKVTQGTSILVDKIAGEMMKKGVFIVSWVNHFVIAPPLIITEEEIRQGMKALDECLGMADDLVVSTNP